MSEHPSFANAILPPGEPIRGKTYRADGWEYRDVPRVTPAVWNGLLDVLGQGNWAIIARTEGQNREGSPFVRGQILISPAGQEAMKSYLAPRN